MDDEGQYAPGGHVLHAVAPSSSWYVPALQLKHFSCLTRSLYVPALQLVAFALPTEQYSPTVQSEQSSLLVITTPIRLVVPPGHGKGAEDCATQ